MTPRRLLYIWSAAALLFTPEVAQAQSSPSAQVAALRTDSTAWQRVLTYVVSMLATDLVRQSADTASQPWNLDVAPGDPQHGLLITQLTTVLRARPVRDADTVFHSMTIGTLTISGDTARVPVNVRETKRCPGTSQAKVSGWSTTMMVRRAGMGFWGAASAGVVNVGDSVNCPNRP